MLPGNRAFMVMLVDTTKSAHHTQLGYSTFRHSPDASESEDRESADVRRTSTSVGDRS
jgi:hypothetical protein